MVIKAICIILTYILQNTGVSASMKYGSIGMYYLSLASYYGSALSSREWRQRQLQGTGLQILTFFRSQGSFYYCIAGTYAWKSLRRGAPYTRANKPSNNWLCSSRQQIARNRLVAMLFKVQCHRTEPETMINTVSRAARANTNIPSKQSTEVAIPLNAECYTNWLQCNYCKV